jgi:hypothetical protein
MFTDETLMGLPAKVRLTGVGLRFAADDEGRASATAAVLRGLLWPLDPDMTDDLMDEHLLALADAGYIVLYAVEGRTYLVLADWPAVDRPRPSRLPAPPPRESLASLSRHPREDFAVVGGGGRQEEAAQRAEGEEARRAEAGAAGEGAAGGGADATRDLREPSPFCRRHPDGSERPCGPCGSARKRHDFWLRDQHQAEASR